MRIHLMTAVAAVGLLAGSAWAAGDNSAASQSSPAAAQPSAAAAERSGSSATMTQSEMQQQLGRDIQIRSGETIGRLDDIVLDAGGKPQKAIIALSDSSKNVAVPFTELQQGSTGWQLKSQSKQQLAAMSSYQHDPSTVSLNHPKDPSGSSSALPSRSSTGSESSPNSSGASPSSRNSLESTPSTRAQP